MINGENIEKTSKKIKQIEKSTNLEYNILSSTLFKNLLFLRQQRFYGGEILTEDLIKKFNTSKSRMSQTLSFLTNKQYIVRTYVANLNNQGSRYRVSLTPRSLEVAEAILSEGLDPVEKKVIEALKVRSNQ